MLESRHRPGQQRSEQHCGEARDRDESHGPPQQRAHPSIGARDQRGRIASQDDDEDQGGRGAHCIQGDQEGDLAVNGRAEHAPGDRVVHETTDPRDEAAEEQDEILPDQAVPRQLGQAVTETQSRAGLHFPGILVSRHVERFRGGIIRLGCPNPRSRSSQPWSSATTPRTSSCSACTPSSPVRTCP